MKLYFAAYKPNVKDIIKTPEKVNLLESYFTFKKEDYTEWHKKHKLENRDLFLDSGAYSAFNSGVKIDLDDYIKYVQKHKDATTIYATLDVIGDWKATKKNTEYMESKGLKPLPVFHYKSPLDELKRMCSKYDYIALGGLVPLKTNTKLLRLWLDTCFKVIYEETMKKGKPLLKVHGFGLTNFSIWRDYPFYSVDSTTWLTGAIFARRLIFEKGVMRNMQKARSKEKTLKRLALCNDNYRDTNMNNLNDMQKGAEYITRVWARRGITFK